MKISELIAELVKFEALHGNIPVLVHTHTGLHPVERPRLHKMQAYDHGSLKGLLPGDGIALVWSRLPR